MLYRYDTPTKYGPIGMGLEIVAVDVVDDYETIEFTITVSLPWGFKEDNTRITHKGDKAVLVMGVSREIPADNRR